MPVRPGDIAKRLEVEAELLQSLWKRRPLFREQALHVRHRPGSGRGVHEGNIRLWLWFRHRRRLQLPRRFYRRLPFWRGPRLGLGWRPPRGGRSRHCRTSVGGVATAPAAARATRPRARRERDCAAGRGETRSSSARAASHTDATVFGPKRSLKRTVASSVSSCAVRRASSRLGASTVIRTSELLRLGVDRDAVEQLVRRLVEPQVGDCGVGDGAAVKEIRSGRGGLSEGRVVAREAALAGRARSTRRPDRSTPAEPSPRRPPRARRRSRRARGAGRRAASA